MARTAAKRAHELVADQLRSRILSGELPNGARLPPEEELTTQFGIARTTLREALRVLESQGLLTIRRGRGGGPEVTHPSLEPAAMALAVSLQLNGATVGDFDAARRMIEPQIAGELARRHKAADIAALEAAIDVAAAAAKANDSQAFVAAAAHMHATLVERSGNVTITTLSRLLDVMVNAYYANAIERSSPRQMQRAVRSYRKLLTLIEAGDSDGAVAHWQAQMRYTATGYDPATPLALSPDRQ